MARVAQMSREPVTSHSPKPDRRTQATVTLAVELRVLETFVPVVLLFTGVTLVAIEPPLMEPPL